MRDGARKVREAADAGGARGESWGWVYDLTESGETAERWVNQANARLSDRAKTQMYAMHGGRSGDVERGRVGGEVSRSKATRRGDFGAETKRGGGRQGE